MSYNISFLNEIDIMVSGNKLRNVSDFRKMIAQNHDTVFQNSGFQKSEIHTNCSAGSMGRTTVYLQDPAEILRRQIFVINNA